MIAERLAVRAVRFVSRVVRLKVFTPLLFTVLVTFVFIVVFVPSSLLRMHRDPDPGGIGSRRVLDVRKGLFPVNFVLPGKLNNSGNRSNDSLQTSSDGRYHLTVIPTGRLGNQMFEFASLLGIADVNDRAPFVSSSCTVTHYFVNVSVSDRPVSGWRIVEEINYARKDSLFDSLPSGNIKLKGFFQSWKYFAGVADKVRQSFTFVPDVQQAVRTFYASYTNKLTDDAVKIGVHVRRSDMLHKVTTRQGYVPAPLSYLVKAFRHMRARFGERSIFFVVTDDPDWCLENLAGNGVKVVDPAPSVVHLGFLALCDHVIMTVGTFGWWGAYLSGGHVVYYDGFPRPGSEISEGFNRRDFYLPHWVPLGD